MTGAVLLIADRLYNGAIVAIVAAGAFGLILTLWYLVPLVRRLRINARSRDLESGRL